MWWKEEYVNIKISSRRLMSDSHRRWTKAVNCSHWIPIGCIAYSSSPCARKEVTGRSIPSPFSGKQRESSLIFASLAFFPITSKQGKPLTSKVCTFFSVYSTAFVKKWMQLAKLRSFFWENDTCAKQNHLLAAFPFKKNVVFVNRRFWCFACLTIGFANRKPFFEYSQSFEILG